MSLMEVNSLLSATKQAVDAYIMDRIYERVAQASVVHPRYEKSRAFTRQAASECARI